MLGSRGLLPYHLRSVLEAAHIRFKSEKHLDEMMFRWLMREQLETVHRVIQSR